MVQAFVQWGGGCRATFYDIRRRLEEGAVEGGGRKDSSQPVRRQIRRHRGE
jgi:hypothetical protein